MNAAKIAIVDSNFHGNCVYTHPAPHHADEVFATAMLSLLTTDEYLFVRRTRNPEELQRALGHNIIYDVGGDFDPKRLIFDHHHNDFFEMRTDGIRYASAGLIWREFGVAILSKLNIPAQLIPGVLLKVDNDLIRGIDARDNSQIDDDGQMTMSSVITIFNTGWGGLSDGSTQFIEACEIARTILVKKIKHTAEILRNKQLIIDKVMDLQTPILIMDHFISGWAEIVLGLEQTQAKNLLYGVYPDSDERWAVSALPVSLEHQMRWKRLFPIQWRGLEGDELISTTGVDTALFCHRAGFFAVAKQQSDAIRLANLSLRAQKRSLRAV